MLIMGIFQSLMEQQKFQEADDFFARALEKDKNDANLYVHRGILYLQWQNDVAKAIKFLGIFISVNVFLTIF